MTREDENKIKKFISDLSKLLSKHDARLLGSDTEVLINSIGIVGYLEDNIDTIEISSGSEVLFSSEKQT